MAVLQDNLSTSLAARSLCGFKFCAKEGLEAGLEVFIARQELLCEPTYALKTGPVQSPE